MSPEAQGPRIGRRGWTKELVQSPISKPSRKFKWRDTRLHHSGKRLDEPATVFYSKQGGYIVVNDRTGVIVQISDRTKPNGKIPWE